MKTNKYPFTSSLKTNGDLPKITKNNLHVLREIFGFSQQAAKTSQLSDVVLFSIDFENTNTSKSELAVNPNCQVGIAILDTKQLEQVPDEQKIQTYNFASGTPSYVARATRGFVFGKTAVVSPSELADSIYTLIPPNRNIVFVGFATGNELRALQLLDFQWPDRLSAVLDAFFVARDILETRSGNLGDLLILLGCPHSSLHCAGNDANFTLKALLLLAAKDLEKHGRNQGLVGSLREIAQKKELILTAPNLNLPKFATKARRGKRGPGKRTQRTKPQPPELQPPKLQSRKWRKKWRRKYQPRLQSRKLQSRSWDVETKDKLRIERRAKKERDVMAVLSGVELESLFGSGCTEAAAKVSTRELVFFLIIQGAYILLLLARLRLSKASICFLVT